MIASRGMSGGSCAIRSAVLSRVAAMFYSDA
jgi:hypothetical protein